MRQRATPEHQPRRRNHNAYQGNNNININNNISPQHTTTTTTSQRSHSHGSSSWEIATDAARTTNTTAQATSRSDHVGIAIEEVGDEEAKALYDDEDESDLPQHNQQQNQQRHPHHLSSALMYSVSIPAAAAGNTSVLYQQQQQDNSTYYNHQNYNYNTTYTASPPPSTSGASLHSHFSNASSTNASTTMNPTTGSTSRPRHRRRPPPSTDKSAVAVLPYKPAPPPPSPRLLEVHSVFRTPHLVSDNQYGAFLLREKEVGRHQQQRRRHVRPQQQQQQQQPRGACGAAGACALFSATGAVFLLWIGILLDTQPLYVAGSLPALAVQSDGGADNGQSSSSSRTRLQYLVPGPHDERLPAATAAYQAALLYALLCVVAWYRHDPTYLKPVVQWCRRLQRRIWGRHRRRRRPWRSTAPYEDVADGAHDDHDDLDDASTAAVALDDHDGGLLPLRYGAIDAYRVGLWGRTDQTVRRWLTVRGWNLSTHRHRRYTNQYAQLKKG